MFLLPRRVEVARAIVNFINFYTMRDSNGFLQGKPGKELRVDALQGPGCYVCLFAYMKASPAIWVGSIGTTHWDRRCLLLYPVVSKRPECMDPFLWRRRLGDILARAGQTTKSRVMPKVEVAVGGKVPRGDQNSHWRRFSSPFRSIASYGFGHRREPVPPNLKSPPASHLVELMSPPKVSYLHGPSRSSY